MEQQQQRNEMRIKVKDIRPSSRLKDFDVTLESQKEPVEGFALYRKRVAAMLSPASKTFVLCTTDREVIAAANYRHIRDGVTHLVADHKDQVLTEQIEETVDFQPHYDTITKSGQYEYYATNQTKPLPFAFAELIDNSLGATALNIKKGEKRIIELRLYLDNDANGNNSAVIVFDNGKGMTVQDLNNWARYKASKFVRKVNDYTTGEIKDPKLDSSLIETEETEYPCFLNSDISYFGAGGKQAVFFIGSSVRMMTKSCDSMDVHEMVISQDDFEKKEREDQDIYKTTIKSRIVGDSSHVKEEMKASSVLKTVIAEEKGNSFTSVAVTQITEEHKTYMKKNFDEWTSQLAHIYHYYLHGPKGNIVDKKEKEKEMPLFCKELEIIVKNYQMKKVGNKFVAKLKNEVNLRDITTDIETRYIREAYQGSCFRFRGASGDKKGSTEEKVEGVIRYFPYLFKRESMPRPDDKATSDTDTDDESRPSSPEPTKAPKREMFECYWNGRLIPYTRLSGFSWCSTSKNVLEEWLKRCSGVLFTNGNFVVTQNKLTFSNSLQEVLTRKESNIENTFVFQHYDEDKKRWQKLTKDIFSKWITKCHAASDKKIQFCGFKEIITRPDLKVERQRPWSTFTSIKWGDREFKLGQTVRTMKVSPCGAGKIMEFALYGDHSTGHSSVYGAEGHVKLQREYVIGDELKYYELSKLDSEATAEEIRKSISKESEKLAHKIDLKFPRGGDVEEGDTVKVNQNLGPFLINLLDKKSDILKRNKKPELTVTMFIVSVDAKDGKETELCEPTRCRYQGHAEFPGFWFNKICCWTSPGICRFKFQVEMGGKSGNSSITLPSKIISFTVIPGDCVEIVGDIETCGDVFKVGHPFDYNIVFKDFYHNITRVPETYGKASLTCSDEFTVTHQLTVVKNNKLVIENIEIKGKLPNEKETKFVVNFFLDKLAGLRRPIPIKWKLIPGEPGKLVVFPEKGDVIELENGTLPTFGVKVYDSCDNQLTNKSDDNLGTCCVFYERGKDGKIGKQMSGTYSLDYKYGPDGKQCILKGKGSLKIEGLKKDDAVVVIARLFLDHHKRVEPVDREVTIKASCRPMSMRLLCCSESDEGPLEFKIEHNDTIEHPVGSIITHIHFKVLDEGDNEVNIAPSLIKSLKANWTTSNVTNVNALKERKLPDLRVPQMVCQQPSSNIVTLTLWRNLERSSRSSLGSEPDHVINFEFYIKPKPRERHSLALSIANDGVKQVKAGSQLKDDLLLKVCDKFGNGVNGITQSSCEEIAILCEVTSHNGNAIESKGLTKSLTKDLGVIAIKGLKFKKEFGHILGIRNVQITYKSMKDTIELEAIAGDPAKLKWEFDRISQNNVMTLIKQSSLRIALQLLDEFENRVECQGVDVILGKDKGLKLTPDPTNALTDSMGRVDFGAIEVSVKDKKIPSKACPLTFNKCSTACFGVFVIKAKTKTEFEGQNAITSDFFKLHIVCDPNKPYKWGFSCIEKGFTVSPEKEIIGADIIVGQPLPAVSVAMLAENCEIVQGLAEKEVVMELAKVNDPSQTQAEIGCTSFDGEFFTFKIMSPRLAGIYTIKFHYRSNGHIASSLYSLRLKCDKPSQLNPEQEPIPGKYVSNTEDIESRTVTKSLTLNVTDLFGNVVANDYNIEEQANLTFLNGKLHIEIIPNEGQPLDKVPHLTGDLKVIPINRGTAIVGRISLEEKTSGVDGTTYVVVLTPRLEGIELAPYKLPFIFVDNAKKQTDLNGLAKKKFDFEKKVKKTKDMLQAIEKEMNDFEITHKHVFETEALVLSKLMEVSPQPSAPVFNSREEIEDEMKIKEQDKERMEQEHIDRSLRVTAAPNEAGVLGKIVHLAKCKNDREALLLSWQLQGDMDLIVTDSTEKMKELHERYRGQQQLIAIRGLIRRTGPWEGLLPHEKIRTNGMSNFRVEGNPVYARHLLTFVKEPEKCKIVFQTLLGETLLMDTLNQALAYRNHLVDNNAFRCPTIITRDGQRLTSIGKIGGSSSRAPNSADRPNFACFGVLPNPAIAIITEELKLLKSLGGATDKRLQSQKTICDFNKVAAQRMGHLQNQLEEETHQLNIYKEQYERLSNEVKQRQDRGHPGHSATPGTSSKTASASSPRNVPKRANEDPESLYGKRRC